MGISFSELLVLLLIVVVLFGTKRLRSVGSDLGAAIKGFRNAVKDPDHPAPSGDKAPIEGETVAERHDQR